MICSKCGKRPAYSKGDRVFALCPICGMEALFPLLEEIDGECICDFRWERDRFGKLFIVHAPDCPLMEQP